MKKIRLQEKIYRRVNLPCSITIYLSESMESFANHDFVIKCMQLLEDLVVNYSMKLLAYCFMPDHVHMVVSVQGDKSIIDFLAAFKSVSTKTSWDFGFEGKLYQRRFYDRFIRKDEDLNQVILYILNNPVRKHIVHKWEDYPYSKCFFAGGRFVRPQREAMMSGDKPPTYEKKKCKIKQRTTYGT